MNPFPFLGYRSSRSKNIVIWQVLADGSPRRQTFASAPRDAETWKVLLAIWPGKTTGSPWHRESLSDDRVFAALERLVRAAPRYFTRPEGITLGAVVLDAAVYGSLKGHAPRAETLRAALVSMLVSTSGAAHVVMSDVLLERLPRLLGFEFECDVVVHHLVAQLSAVVPQLLTRSQRFKDALAEWNRAVHQGQTFAVTPGDLDWSDVSAVNAAFAAHEWNALGEGFRETDPRHVKTLFGLAHEQRVGLCRVHARFATRVSNAGALLLPEGKFEEALVLYDAALEGELPPVAMHNALYAVSDDNNGLGLERERVRAPRYLERCLPLGPSNGYIFLNAALVLVELEQPDRAIEMLRAAKRVEIKVAPYQSEPLFEVLRDRDDFRAIMGAA